MHMGGDRARQDMKSESVTVAGRRDGDGMRRGTAGVVEGRALGGRHHVGFRRVRWVWIG